MRWARVALYSFLGIFTLLAIAVVLLMTMDLGRFKGTTESLLSNLLNREFAIDGDFQVHLGRHIHIVAGEVSLKGTDWSAYDHIASIGHLEGSVDAWSLINWPILIESLRIEAARAHLEHNAAGENNWTFFQPKPESAEETGPKKRFSLPVMLVDADIRDLKLTYDNPNRPRPFELSATEVTATQTDANTLRVDITGDINETPLELSATAGPVDHLVDFYGVDFGARISLGEIQLEGEAQFGNLIRPRRPTISLSLQGPNAEYLTGILRLQQVTTGPLDLTASIAPVGERMQLLLNGEFGEFSLDVSGGFADLQELRDIDLRVAASGPDASTIAKLIGNDKVPEDPFSIVGNLQRTGSSLLVDEVRVTVGKTRFEIGARFGNFPDPRDANVSIHIDGPDFGRFNRLLGFPGRLGGAFKLDADLAPLPEGGAKVDVTAIAQDVQYTIAGNITDDPDFLGTKVELTFSGPNLRTVTSALGITDAPAAPFDLNLLVDRVENGVTIENGSMALGDDRLIFSGLVGNKPLEADTDIHFEMTGPDFAGTLVAFGRDAEELPYAQYRVGGRIERGPEYFILHDISAAIGDDLEYELGVDGQVSVQPKFEESRVRVTAKGASLGALTDAAGIGGIPDLPFEVGGYVERTARGFSVESVAIQVGDNRANLQGLIGEKPLEADTDIRFDATVPDLKATLGQFGLDVEALPSGELRTAGELIRRGDHFSVQNLTASLAGANVNVDGRLGDLSTLDGTELKIQVNGIDLANLLPDDEKFSALNKPYGLSANVRLADQHLTVEDIEAFVDKARLTADVELSLAPMLGNGHFSIDASSPDMYVLVPSLTEIATDERAPLELHTDGSWANTLWTLDNFALQLGEGNMTASGMVDGPPSFERTDLRFDWNISSVRKMSVLAGRDLPDDPAHLKFHLTGTRDLITLQDFDAAIGESDIHGEFSLRGGEIPEIHVGFTSEHLDLLGYIPEPPEEVVPEAQTAEAAPKKDRVIPDTVIPIDELMKYLVSVDIRIAELKFRQQTQKNIVLAGGIHNGALVVEEFNLENDLGGALAGTFEIHPAESGAELKLAVLGSGLTIGLPAETEEELQALPTYELDIVLHGSGATVRELAGSLDGYVQMVVGEGKLKATALRFLTSDFLYELLNTINPFAKSDPHTNFLCAAILLRIEDGVIAGKPAVVSQSERLRIFANATIDLKTEKLSADINAIPQKGLGLSFSDLVNPFTKLGGTLASPTLTVDPAGALIEGGAAVATAGLSILAKRFNDRFLSEKDACGKAVTDAEPEFRALKELYYPGDDATL